MAGILPIRRKNPKQSFNQSTSSRTTGPDSTKLGTKHPRVKGIKFVQMKGHALFQGMKSRNGKNTSAKFKILLLQNRLPDNPDPLMLKIAITIISKTVI